MSTPADVPRTRSRASLAEFRPTLIVAMDSGLWEEATTFLGDAGYCVFDPDDLDRAVVSLLFNVLARPK